MQSRIRAFCLAAAALALAGVAPLALAATDIASSPLVVSSPDTVKANMLFILDDSGSMGFDFMPDHVGGSLCRSRGAAISTSDKTANNYSGDFGGGCCTNANSSTTCYSGAAPFGNNRAQPPFLSSSFNGMAYNPATRYQPPVKADGTEWASQTNWKAVKNDAYNIQNTNSIDLTTQFPDVEYCTDTTYTNCLRNDNYVLPGKVGGVTYDKYHVTSAKDSGKVASGAPDAAVAMPADTGTGPNVVVGKRDFGPHYYVIVPAEYCVSDNLRDCQIGSAGSYTVPAPVRWCKTDAEARASTPTAGACQGLRTDVYTQARYPTKFFTKGSADTTAVAGRGASVSFNIALGGTCNNSRKVGVGTLMVNGINLLAGASTTLNSDRDDLAASIRDVINSKSGSTKYVASGSGATVTITAPMSIGNFTGTATLSRAAGSNASCTFTPTSSGAFSGYKAEVPFKAGDPAGFSGSFKRVDIVPSRTDYPRASTRTDCSAATCTYEQEMTNFANWWAYYHTRMQSMKSSASRAFDAVGNNRRIGYLSINNSTNSDFLNLAPFETSQRASWFDKLIKAEPKGSTPLRAALSKAGNLFAGKLNGTTFNGSTVKDPMEYSCQSNFTILSTDGFWNEADSSLPKKFDGSNFGDEDGALPRPKLDGNKTALTLADFAYYYANTDSRTGTTGTDACKSGDTGADVCGNGLGPANTDEKQVMKTFTVGLGASGSMLFRPKYLTDTSGDFYSIQQPTTPNAAAGVCTWESATSTGCNWPKPENNKLTTIDDLWHAAVNGDGTYFSAADPSELYTGLATALKNIDGTTAAAAAATTSNPNVSAGDNQLFVSNFKSSEWSGELISQRLNIETGVVESDINGLKTDWSASLKLNANTNRKIYMFAAASPNKRKEFTWEAMTTLEQENFTKPHITTTGRRLTQFCSFGSFCVSSADQDKAAGKPLVDFLRGERSQEGQLTEPLLPFRQRAHKLGDIVNSEAVYVKQASFDYADSGYGSHKGALATRAGRVYVGANDGMLHAFDTQTGEEAWAYIPTLMLPKLYRLADKEYASKHEYFVDGTPTVQDVFDGSKWITLLVGGMGAGGRGYYALDVTDPNDPKMLWEFTDDNLGYTMGKAEIGKLRDGTWVVIFGSGYNNVSPGDGKGHLFIVNAADGSLVRTPIATGAGSLADPSGLAHIRGWVDNGDADNTFQRVYGGDNQGNVWRFDINNIVGTAGYDAQRLATLKAPNGSTAQPITSRPELGLIGTTPMVFVGTGRYLGTTDLTDATKQSIYAIKDRMDAQDWGNPRDAANKFVQQVLTTGECPTNTGVCSAASVVRVGTNNTVGFTINGGWYVDLPETRERVNTDPQLALGTLIVNSNVVETGKFCKVGGSSYANFLDYRTGAPVSTANGVVSVPLGAAIATRPAPVKLPNNKVISISELSNTRTVSPPAPINVAPGTTRRLSWRDLIQN